MIDDRLLAALTGAEVDAPASGPFTGVATNSREVRPGDLFVALPGTRDGHDFLDDAVAAGATGVLVTRPYDAPPGVAVVRVPATLPALQELGAAVRAGYDVDAVAITGSVGKTTTKDLLAHVLADEGHVLSSPKSYNNHLGVPLTLLLLEPTHTGLVAEIGTNHPGEIRPLVDLVRPRAALVTKVGFAHLGNFASQDDLADEKASIFSGVRPDGVWFVNADDPVLRAAVDRLERPAATRVVTFGLSPEAEVRVTDLAVTEDGTTGVVHVDGEQLPFRFPLTGLHFAGTVASVVAIAVERGIAPATAVARLATFGASEGRASMTTIRDGAVRVIDDSYNGSPDSMLAALDTLASCAEPRRIAVLGEMRELGDWSERLHQEVGAKVGTTATELVFIGPSAPVVGTAATAAGLPAARFHAVDSAPAAADLVEELLADGSEPSAVLVKGARFVHTERVPLVLDGVAVRCRRELCTLYIRCAVCPNLLVGD